MVNGKKMMPIPPVNGMKAIAANNTAETAPDAPTELYP